MAEDHGNTALTLSVESGLGPNIDKQLSDELFVRLNGQREFTVRRPTGGRSGAQRGDASLLGQIAIALVSSGAAVALIQAIAPLFHRAPATKIRLKFPDGTEAEIESTSIKGEAVDLLIERLKGNVVPNGKAL